MYVDVKLGHRRKHSVLNVKTDCETDGLSAALHQTSPLVILQQLAAHLT